ncbi:MAG TPA: asparagine synthase-related protein [Allosphingosinicella sp.]|jgi:asparagine synthase (glutamine-hydrolysing)
MTVLAVHWDRRGGAGAANCEAMLRAQWPRAAVRSVAADGAIGLDVATAEAGAAGLAHGAGGRLILAADARIDGRADLVRQLGLDAAQSRDLGDAALMMLCFEKWGAEAVDAFVGDYALALWDGGSGSLLLARDISGQRPLHFHAASHRVAAASMAKGLHALDWIPRGVHERRMLETLAGLPHEGSSTFFRGIERVEPGQALTLTAGGRSARAVWVPPRTPLRFSSLGECAEALRDALDTAVADRLRGAGAVLGTHLSAGLDSSAVATSAARQFGGRVVAFTAVPSHPLPPLPDGRFGDEGDYAAETASLYPNMAHRRIAAPARLPLEDLAWQLPLFERPDLNLPNLAWSNRINDAAVAEGIRVMLVATTGNATISYGGAEAIEALLVDVGMAGMLPLLAQLRRAGIPVRTILGQVARRLLPAGAVAGIERLRRRPSDPRLGVLNLSAPGAAAVLARHDTAVAASEASIPQRLGMIGRPDPGTYAKGVYLHWGLELCDPTADRRVVDLCLQMPPALHFSGGQSRAPIRAALRGRVPESVLGEGRRGLQAADWFAMLTAARPEAAALLDDVAGCEAAGRLVDMAKLRRLLDEWPGPDAGFGPLAYRFGLLRGLSAGHFVRINSPDAPAGID